MTHSSSPSDFWGRRWNALVHIVLKGAIYVPLRRNGFSKGIAALATFAASGVLHEYVLTAIDLKRVVLGDHTAYAPKYGIHLAFFAWNGVVLSLEGIFHNHPFIQKLKKSLPSPAITAMVIMTVLPVAHWFTGESAKCVLLYLLLWSLSDFRFVLYDGMQ
jgi:Membrane bound O-acyl transferase family